MAQPEVVFRHGTCSASVFQNEVQTNDGAFKVRDVCFQRRYRDKGGAWQTANSLRVNDIPKAVLVLNKAYEYLTCNGHADAGEEEA